MRSWLAALLLATVSAVPARSQSPCAIASSGFARPGVDQFATTAVAYDDGTGPGLYVAGRFTAAGPIAAMGIARLRGGTWTSVGAGISGGSATVNTVVTGDVGSGSRLFAAGNFTTAGATSVANVAAWDGAQWSSLGAPASTVVNALLVFDDGSGTKLYAAGNFGASGPMVMRYDGSSWTGVGAGLTGTGTTLAVHDDGTGPALHVGYVNASDGTSVAKWNGTSWFPLGILAPQGVVSLASVDDGGGPKLYAAAAQSVAPSSVQRWTGSAWQSVGSLNDVIHRLRTLDLQDGNGPRLYAARQAGLSRWTGAAWVNVGSNVPAATHDVCLRLHAGVPELCAISWIYPQLPPQFGGSIVSRLVGNQWLNATDEAGIEFLAPSLSSITSLASYDSGSGPQVFVAGLGMNSGPELVNQSLGTWNGTHWATAPSPAGIFDRLQLFSVGTPPSQSLYLSVEYDNLYVRSGNTWNVVGGPFGYHRSSVTRFDLGTGPHLAVTILNATPSFPPPGNQPYSQVYSDNVWLGETNAGYTISATLGHDDGSGPALYVVGNFTSFMSVAGTKGIARWNGTSWSSVGGGIVGGGLLNAIMVHDFGSGPELCVGGAFGSLGSATGGGVARWNGTSWSSVGASGMSGFYGPMALVEHDDGSGKKLYAAGDFTVLGGVSASRIAAFDGVQWQPLGSGANGNVFVMASLDEGLGAGPALWLSGEFDTVCGVPSGRIARIGCFDHAGTPTCLGDGSHGPTACPCGNPGAVGHGCANANAPAGGRLSATGSTALGPGGTDTVVFTASDLPALAPILFFQGSVEAAPAPFGDGALCVAGTLTRLAIRFSDASGSVSWPTGTDPSVSVSGATPPGSGFERVYQGWFRTITPTCSAATYNLTNGWRLVW